MPSWLRFLDEFNLIAMIFIVLFLFAMSVGSQYFGKFYYQGEF